MISVEIWTVIVSGRRVGYRGEIPGGRGRWRVYGPVCHTAAQARESAIDRFTRLSEA